MLVINSMILPHLGIFVVKVVIQYFHFAFMVCLLLAMTVILINKLELSMVMDCQCALSVSVCVDWIAKRIYCLSGKFMQG